MKIQLLSDLHLEAHLVIEGQLRWCEEARLIQAGHVEDAAYPIEVEGLATVRCARE